MAKGKYKARKENRDATQLAEDLARVRAELLVEQQRLDEVRGRAEVDRQLRVALAAAISERDAVCAPQIERIAADRDVIVAATRDLVAANDSLRHAETVLRWAWTALGPEMVYALLTGNRAFLLEGIAHDGLSHDAAEVIQRVRGIRKYDPVDFTGEQRRALSKAAAAAAGIEFAVDTPDDDDAAWAAYSDRVRADPAAVIAFMTPLPWLDIASDGEHPVSRMLGGNPEVSTVTVDPVKVVPSVAEVSTGTAALRDAVTAAGATSVAKAWLSTLQNGMNNASGTAVPSLVAATSVYPSPADAAALHAWYAAVAMGAWGRRRSVTDGRVAVAAGAAVPFWLPPGHTIAYLDSEPLSDEDVDDLRLPFPQVLVTFAEPPRLPALDSGVLAEDDPRLQYIDHTLTRIEGSEVPDSRELMIAGTNGFTAELPTLWDVLSVRGAHIEGVLLLADAHGHLDDLFAWCVAVPSTTAGTVMGRWVIPASRSATSYANLVTNAAAVAAWADWHRPGQSRDAEDPGPRGGGRPGRQGPEDSVHVLNVSATSAAADAAGKGEPTGRTTAPHRRRGHWRRQHYGPGRAQVRRVRIAPVLVNAGRRGSGRPQIYRLPAPTRSGASAT